MGEQIKFLHSDPWNLVKKWGTKWSLWPVHLVTACCGVELAHTYASGYDGERIGSLNYGIARQTNLIIVEGAITRKMAKVLRVTWEQMPEPKFVIVMGACGLKGGIFWNGYHLVKPSDIVPVDFFIPGCPPTPEALLRAIRALQDKIMSGIAKTTAEFKKGRVEEGEEAKRAPSPPHKFSRTPTVKIDIPKETEWKLGKEIIELLKEELDGIYESITVTSENRICLKVKAANLPEIAERLVKKFDHIKSVNVVDVPHEKKFIVEYTASSYSVKELMPVLLTIMTEIERENPKLKSLADYWPSADYMEREMYDFFGIWFEGNPWMGRNFLIEENTPKFPLRKDFTLKRESYVG